MIRLAVIKEKQSDYFKNILCSIPHILTLLNALCGFLAITKAIDGNCLQAAYWIIAAAIIDGCDGLVARALNSCTEFGEELDSLADAVSFCGAPMVLMYQWISDGGIPNGATGIALLLGIYVCAGLWRLATFNTSTADRMCFKGLPTTVAALTIALMIVYEPWLSQHSAYAMQQIPTLALVLILGGLMVSSVSFVKLNKAQVLISKKKLMIFLLIVASCAHKVGVPLFLLYVYFYIAANLVCSLRRFLYSKK